jgi:hypothetical protein
MGFMIISIQAALLLELFDFPPIWGIFDAHSLWHATTAPLAKTLWDFHIEDALFEISNKAEKMV